MITSKLELMQEMSFEGSWIIGVNCGLPFLSYYGLCMNSVAKRSQNAFDGTFFYEEIQVMIFPRE